MYRFILALVAIVGLASSVNAQYPVYSSYSVGPFGRVRGFASVAPGYPAIAQPFGVTAYGYSPFGVSAYGYHPAALGARSYGYVPFSTLGAVPIDPCPAPVVTSPAPIVSAPAAFGVRTFYYSSY